MTSDELVQELETRGVRASVLEKVEGTPFFEIHPAIPIKEALQLYSKIAHKRGIDVVILTIPLPVISRLQAGLHETAERILLSSILSPQEVKEGEETTKSEVLKGPLEKKCPSCGSVKVLPTGGGTGEFNCLDCGKGWVRDLRKDED